MKFFFEHIELPALEIIIDLPLGFPINNKISLELPAKLLDNLLRTWSNKSGRINQNIVRVLWWLIFVRIVAGWKPQLEHQNVPSVRAGAPRNTYKKQTNQLVKNNVGKTIQFMKKISISNFWKNKGMIREFAWLFGVLLSKKGGKWFERCWIITIF